MTPFLWYLHLRNPAVLKKTLTAPEAASVIENYRRHPRWKAIEEKAGPR